MNNDKRNRTATRKAVNTSIRSAKTDLTNENELENNESRLKGLAALLRVKVNVLDDLETKILASCEEEDVDREASDSNE